MNGFITYHPTVNLLYFVFVIGFSCFFMHPVCLIISLICGFIYSAMLGGKKTIVSNLLYMLPMFAAFALINPLFNHEGMTVIAYMNGGNPITLESIIYGICAAAMIITVICWFSCFSKVMTSDKLVFLFGKVIPSLSLIFSMTLRFIPRFKAQLKVVANAQRCMGRNHSSGGIVSKAKHGLNILSIMVTWSLENAVETSDSMRSRGYGLAKRSTFSMYSFGKRDIAALSCISVLGVYTIIGAMLGRVDFDFFPTVSLSEITPYGISVFSAYYLLCMIPVIMEIWEVRKWNALRSKI